MVRTRQTSCRASFLRAVDKISAQCATRGPSVRGRRAGKSSIPSRSPRVSKPRVLPPVPPPSPAGSRSPSPMEWPSPSPMGLRSPLPPLSPLTLTYRSDGGVAAAAAAAVTSLPPPFSSTESPAWCPEFLGEWRSSAPSPSPSPSPLPLLW